MEPKADIVITTLQNWDIGIGSNIINIASGISKSHRVLFVNYALDRSTLLRKRNPRLISEYRQSKRDNKQAIRRIDENLWVFTPGCVLESIHQVGPRPLFNLLNKMNGRRFAHEISKAVNHLGFNDFILIMDNDHYRGLYLKELLKPSRFVYYLRDYTVSTPYFKKHGLRVEPLIIGKADVVMANSGYLAAYARRFNPATYDVGQGCDITLYDPAATYPELPGFPVNDKPVIGYAGAIVSLRLDPDILLHIARSKPEWNLLLVGPEDDYFRQSELHRMPNVFFTGAKPPGELPAWISRFDVAINPQLVNEVTIGNYPRKVDEYLAMGKPVVATRTEAMELFRDHVFLADNPAIFVEGIEQSLVRQSEDMRQARIGFARSHSWPLHVEKLLGILNI